MIANSADDPGPSGSMAEMRASFGMAVRLLRTERGWSLADAVKQLRVSERYIWEVERGSANPSLEVQDQIAQGFGLSHFELMQATEEQRRRRQARRDAGEKVEEPPPSASERRRRAVSGESVP